MSALRAELNQRRLRGGQRLPKKLLSRVLREIAKEVPKTKGKTVSIAFISPREMRTLNHTYRGKDAMTDVLSFPLEAEEVAGEVLISYKQAKRQAAQMGHTTRDELVFLIVHGVLHVFGYDHETPKDAQHMFPLQTKILKRLGVNPRI